MPLYHFHCTDGGFSPDTDGTELPSFSAARTEAVRYAGALVKDRPDLVRDGTALRVEVTDGVGSLLCTVVVLGIDAPAARGVLAA